MIFTLISSITILATTVASATVDTGVNSNGLKISNSEMIAQISKDSVGNGTNCTYPCQTCDGSGAFNCTSCYSGYELAYRRNPYTGEYGYTCIQNQTVCHWSCNTCNGTSEYDCTSCNNGSTLLSGQDPNTQVWGQYCDLTANGCSNGTYFNNSNNTCDNCSWPCNTCDGSGAYNCRGCNSGYYFEWVNSTSGGQGYTCVNRNCSSNEFFDEETAQCESCHDTCRMCTGRGGYNCSACYAGYSLTSRYNNATGRWGYKCIKNGTNTTCPSGEWYNNQTSQCENCSSVCAECDGSGGYNCTACPAGQNLTWAQNPLNGNWGYTCGNGSNTTCQAQEWWNNQTMQCENCSSLCNTCHGSGDFNCSGCWANHTLRYSYDNSTGQYGWTCVENSTNTTCPDGQWYNNATGQCENCSSTCKECSGAGAYNCTQCHWGYDLAYEFNNATGHYGWTCVKNGTNTTCPSREWYNNQTNQCENCSTVCYNCNGAGDYNCTSCPTNSSLTYGFNNATQQYGWTCNSTNGTNLTSALFNNGDHCHKACQFGKCAGPTHEHCYECASGHFAVKSRLDRIFKGVVACINALIFGGQE